MRERMREWIESLQDEICEAIEALDGNTFREDHWERPGGGGGRSRVIQDSEFFEKAGVNTSAVFGTLTPEAARSMGGGREIEDLSFFATGISLVLHPINPMAPTVHANYRYVERGQGAEAWWFGGGADLTPSYLFEEDARHFHRAHRDALDRHDPELYAEFKAACDDYFYLPHRQEARGVGGIFFDDFARFEQEACFAMVRDLGRAFLPSYLPIVARRSAMAYGPEQKRWQALRRGRYVEFNLVWDRGTQFGLRTAGRIESILMSLPLHARWEYAPEVEPGSHEARTLEVLRAPRDWLAGAHEGRIGESE